MTARATHVRAAVCAARDGAPDVTSHVYLGDMIFYVT